MGLDCTKPLSLSHPTDAPRPPAQDDGSLPPQSNFSTQPAVRRSKRRGRRPRAAPAPAPAPAPALRPVPPPIFLPGPSEPIPPNLLRNQANLLGTAGVVANVRPSQIVHNAPHGDTPSNPIIVQEPEDPIRLRKKRTRASDTEFLRIAAPSTRDIVDALVRQGEIYEVLEQITKFVAERAAREAARTSGPAPATNAHERGKKRRKLRHVPAGADLWDVPFPFVEGEGPQQYRDHWEKERGRKLISQLVALIKGAAKRAALKKRMQLYPLPSTDTPASFDKHLNVGHPDPSNSAIMLEIFGDASNASRPYVSPPSPAPVAAPVVDPLDALLSTLLAVPVNDKFAFETLPSANEPLDVFDKWMGIFDTYQFPENGFAVPQGLSLPAADDGPLSFDLRFDLDPNVEPNAVSSATTVGESLLDPLFMALSTADLSSLDTSSLGGSSMVNSPIAPTSSLPSESFTPVSDSGLTDVGSGSAAIPDFRSLDPNHLPTMEEFEQFISAIPNDLVNPTLPVATEPLDLLTTTVPQPSLPTVAPPFHRDKGKQREVVPSTVGWTEAEQGALSYLEQLSMANMSAEAQAILNSEGGQGGVGLGNMFGGADVASTGGASNGPIDVAVASGELTITASTPTQQNGVQMPVRPLNAPPNDEMNFSEVPTMPLAGHDTKAVILSRAKARREQLRLEIVQRRIALWETTIEGGVLATLVGKYNTP
uniref:Uncharacterized protein n=1 Tax=Mycena chlorophos TaxID=658473 RepID=A0ABQ0MCF5_MYCCL|nr:predicted protein [Mycena chlorophos]